MTKAKRKQGQPITAHRLFPTVTALWFAALLGLVAFVVPPQMLERAVALTGLPKVLHAAAAPLGFTARALIALILAGIGGMAGFAIAIGVRPRPAGFMPLSAPEKPARRKGKAGGVPEVRIRARDAHPDAPPRRPLVPSEDLEAPAHAEVLPAADAPLVRRRALVLTGESVQGDVAGGVIEGPALPEIPTLPEITQLPGTPPFGVPAEFAPAEFAMAEVVAEPTAPFAEPQEDAGLSPLDGHVAESPFTAAPDAGSFDIFQVATRRADAGAESPIANLPLVDLGLVQLIERLAMAISARKDKQAEIAKLSADAPLGNEVVRVDEPAIETPQDGDGDGDGAAQSPVAADTEAESVVETPVVPSQAGELLLDEAADAIEVSVPRFLSVANEDAPFAVPGHGTAETGAADAVGARPVPLFGAPAAHQSAPFARPLAIRPFPAASADAATGQAAAPYGDADEADHALRAALAKLQRMTAKG